MIHMKRVGKIVCGACSIWALAVVLSACQEKRHSDYLSTGKELALNQKYRGFPELPAARADFETALRRNGLRAEERVVKFTEDKPLTCPGPIGASQELKQLVDKCLLISGPGTKDVAERYVAFIDPRGNVIFVENIFEYPGR